MQILEIQTYLVYAAHFVRAEIGIISDGKRLPARKPYLSGSQVVDRQAALPGNLLEA